MTARLTLRPHSPAEGTDADGQPTVMRAAHVDHDAAKYACLDAPPTVAGRPLRATINGMAEGRGNEHALVLYKSSERADERLRETCRDASRVTVVVMARKEPERSGCCDTRSTLWNGICRDLAHEELSRAHSAVRDVERVDFRLLVAPAREVVGSITREAVARKADRIVVADAGGGIGRLERRRLSRISPVPVVG
jgi:hypothetical protein